MEAPGSYFQRMRSVGLKVLKNRLSEYVRIAANGEVVLVTDRDVVVAELSPPSSSRTLRASDALLAESVRSGWVTPATLAQSGVPTRKPVTTFKSLMRELDRDREER